MIRHIFLSAIALSALCVTATADPQFQGTALSAMQSRVAQNATAIGANTTAIQTEAATARNASNLTSGTVPAAQIPFGTTAGTVASGLVDLIARSAVQPGSDVSSNTVMSPLAGSYPRSSAERATDVIYLLDYVPTALRPAILAGTSTADVTSYVQQAINNCNNCLLFATGGRYQVNGFDKLHGTMWLKGAGKNKTIFVKGGTSGTGLFYVPSGPTTYDLDLSSFTIDVNNIDTGINVDDVVRFTARDLEIKNIKTWGIQVGASPAETQTTALVNQYITIDGNDFDTSSSTYEQVLIYNTADAQVTNNRFLNGAASSIGLGLYQNDDRIWVGNNLFQNLQVGSYYSVSTNNITYFGNRFANDGTGIKGANLSDNGSFGYSSVLGLNAINNYFTGNTTAFQVGAAIGATIDNNTFYANLDNALVFNGGNTGTAVAARFASVTNNKFHNNNSSGTVAGLHTPIFFQGIGGEFDMTLSGNKFWDDQSTPTQLDTIGFDGAYTWSFISFMNDNLSAYGGGASIVNLDGAALSNVTLTNVTNLTGTPPSGVTVK